MPITYDVLNGDVLNIKQGEKTSRGKKEETFWGNRKVEIIAIVVGAALTAAVVAALVFGGPLAWLATAIASYLGTSTMIGSVITVIGGTVIGGGFAAIATVVTKCLRSEPVLTTEDLVFKGKTVKGELEKYLNEPHEEKSVDRRF